jgi:hypothetical protein
MSVWSDTCAQPKRSAWRCKLAGGSSDAGADWRWRPDLNCCCALVGRRLGSAQVHDAHGPIDAACLGLATRTPVGSRHAASYVGPSQERFG